MRRILPAILLSLLIPRAAAHGAGHGGPARGPSRRGRGSSHRRRRRAGQGAMALQRRRARPGRPPRTRSGSSSVRPANRTNDISPHAEAADFDDSAWETIEPAALETRRSNGRLAFNWYRTRVTLPAKVGGFDVAGSTVVLELVLDDYAEIWVDGQLPLVLGQTGGQLIKGFNAPNRVVLTRGCAARASRSSSPSSASTARSPVRRRTSSGFARRRSTSTARVSSGGAQATHREGRAARSGARPDHRARRPAREAGRRVPVHRRARSGIPTAICSSAIPTPTRSIAGRPRARSRSTAARAATPASTSGEYRQPGSNGLTLDRDGRLTINEHGNRRVTRLERTGQITVLADRYEGKRLNSPNDLVYRSDGTLYFTDPPFGLPKAFDDPAEGAAVQRRVHGEGRHR